MKAKTGFTLIELLVVIAIIAILSVVVILTLNPAELLRQSRDSGRISDPLGTLRTAISLYLADTTVPQLASTSLSYAACYLSTLSGVGTTTAKCGAFQSAAYTATGSTTSLLYRNINTTGWVPVNFSSMSAGSPFGSLPVDPTNNANLYYAYAATSSGGYFFKLTGLMESRKYAASGTSDVVSTDGGASSTIYEVGNSLAL